MKNKAARLQSGVVPYVIVGGEMHVCLIRMKHEKGNRGWGLPKGGVEPKMTLEASAAKEADEEAGLIGEVKHNLGATEYVKGDEGNQHVTWFCMKVTKTKDIYDEWQIRERRWFSVEDAVLLLTKDVAEIMLKAEKKLASKKESKFLPKELDW